LARIPDTMNNTENEPVMRGNAGFAIRIDGVGQRRQELVSDRS